MPRCLRLARNGRDWHHLLELCGFVEAPGYRPQRLSDPNDRLLLGMKGSISEFELGIIRSRMYEAARSKARRGELRLFAPIGYNWAATLALNACRQALVLVGHNETEMPMKPWEEFVAHLKLNI